MSPGGTAHLRRDQDNHCRREGDDDIGELLVGESAGRYFAVEALNLRGKPSYFVVTQERHRLLHLPGIEFRRLKYRAGRIRAQEAADLPQPGLPAQLSGTNLTMQVG